MELERGSIIALTGRHYRTRETPGQARHSRGDHEQRRLWRPAWQTFEHVLQMDARIEAPSYPHVELPASALLDTLLLPLSVLTVLGVGFNATGGL